MCLRGCPGGGLLKPQRLAQFWRGIPIPVGLFFRADNGIQTFSAGQGALNSVGSQEGFAFKFESQGNVQHVERAATEPLRVFFGQ